MTVRPLQPSDMDEIRTLYNSSVLQDGFPDFAEMVDAQVVIEDENIVAVAAVRMVPEFVMILGQGHPAARLYWLKLLYGKMLDFLKERGLKRGIAFVPPQIEKAYGRRLTRMFGFQPGMSAFIYITEEENVNGNSGKIRVAGE